MNTTESIKASIDRAEAELTRIRREEFLAQTSQWEYLVQRNLSVEAMNDLGHQGYELVAVASFSTGGELSINGIGGGKYVVHLDYSFKRRLPRYSERVDRLMVELAEMQDKLQLVLGDLNQRRSQGLEAYDDGFWVMFGAPHGKRWRYRISPNGRVEIENHTGGVSESASLSEAVSTYTWWTNVPSN